MAANTGRKVSASKDSPVSEKKASRSSKEKKAVKPVIEYLRRFVKDTTGTFRFEAVNLKGVVLKQEEASVSQLYVRRSSPAMQGDPRFLKVTVEVLDSLPDEE
jgi:hypothetical protein